MNARLRNTEEKCPINKKDVSKYAALLLDEMLFQMNTVVFEIEITDIKSKYLTYLLTYNEHTNNNNL